MHLIVTEKHNAAMRISGILSRGESTRTSVNDVPVYSWNGGNTKCIGLAGHVVEMDFPDEYADWNSNPPRALVNADVVVQPSKPDLVRALETLSQKASRATIATDFDREGELIGKEAHDIITEVNSSISIDRARFSSITAPEVFDAFDSPTTIDFNLAEAGEARQIIDLLWGASLTRFLTLNGDRPGSDILSVGRVQTPTLAIVVNREREIENFDPDDYWEIYADCKPEQLTDSLEGQYFFRDSDENEVERITTGRVAKGIFQDINSANRGVVDAVDEYTRADNPPTPFSTTEFIKAANAIDFEAKRAMSIAESLYTEGYISYPRTENTVYPDDLDHESRVTTLTTVKSIEESAERILEQDDLSPTRGDTESTDHPPIHPTDSPPAPDALTEDEWDIYELVARRYLATLASPGEWAHTRLDIAVNSHLLKVKGRRLVDPGYHAVYPYYDNDQTEVPSLDEGEEVKLVDARLAEKQTQPPNRFGQSRLVEEMKAKGLGTKSTRHNTIDKLYDRDYIKGNPPRPTPIARTLIDTMDEYAPQLTSEEMTATLEGEMSSIADGEASRSAVTTESREMLRDVFDSLESNTTAISAEFGDIESSNSGQSTDPIGPCPDCGEDLQAREGSGDSQFIGCSGYPDCEYSLPLPQKGRPHILDETCDDHGLHIVKMIAGSETFVYGCPACEQKKANEKDDRELGPCPECESGAVAIKYVQTGSRLVGCTDYPSCEYSVPIPQDGDIDVVEKECGEHQTNHIHINQEDSNSVWELGCPICSYEEYKS